MSEPPAEHRGSAYSSAGVDYEALDAGKRSALTEALTTSGLLGAHGGRAVDESRGEPAFVFELEGRAFGFVVEGLGTKSIIARQVEEQLGVDAFDNVAYDTVAAIVNDLCCVGALPMVVNAYFATGSSEWYRREDRHAALLTGWREACADAGAVWGGGESPSLPELVHGPDIELAGSAVGLVPGGRPAILGADLASGDEIVLVESNGLHANGSSLARLIASRLPDGYRTTLPSGRTFGEALVDRSAIYVGLVRELLASTVEVHYLSHITGHGLLKLMRPRRELTYTIESLPEVPEVLEFLAAQAGMSPSAAYSTFNMGCGFAVYCARESGGEVVAIASRLGLKARVAGAVEQGPRQVVLEEVGVRFDSGDMDLGPRRHGHPQRPRQDSGAQPAESDRRRMERAVHDRGGVPTDARIDRREHSLADWEVLTDAMMGALGKSGLMNVDELRRGIESMPPDRYEQASYYERWLYSIETILTEKGVLAPGEVDRKLLS